MKKHLIIVGILSVIVFSSFSGLGHYTKLDSAKAVTPKVLPPPGGGYTCDIVTDAFLDMYATAGEIGFVVHLHCSSPLVTVHGTACMQTYDNVGGVWGWRDIACWGYGPGAGDLYIWQLMPCFNSQGATWLYRSEGFFGINWPNGTFSTKPWIGPVRGVKCVAV